MIVTLVLECISKSLTINLALPFDTWTIVHKYTNKQSKNKFITYVGQKKSEVKIEKGQSW